MKGFCNGTTAEDIHAKLNETVVLNITNLGPLNITKEFLWVVEGKISNTEIEDNGKAANNDIYP